MNTKKVDTKGVKGLRIPVLLACLALVVSLGGGAAQAQEQPQPPGQKTPQDKGLIKTWPETKREIKEYFPRKIEETKTRIRRFRIVRMPKTVVEEYSDNQALFVAITTFYDYIKGRELDVFEEQEGIPRYFPTRDAYYDFLDTILPAMRDRRFERNRLLSYSIHKIEQVEGDRDKYEVQISIESDDIFPFGKVMLFTQTWQYGIRGWYPGKVKAESATYWERVR